MAAGVPVVASDATSLPEVMGGAAAGLVDAEDAVGAAQILLRLEADRPFHADRRAAGLQRAQDFSWDRSAERFWENIERILP